MERQPEGLCQPIADETSQPFVGRWNRLVSTTNWEKGRIIGQWRQALIADDAPSSQYSDDVWSSLVGGVTPQHVGRLPRSIVRAGYPQSGSRSYKAPDPSA